MNSLILGAFLRPLFWLVVLGLALWIVRKAFPRAERVLFDMGAFEAIGSIIRSARTRIRVLRGRPRGQ